MYAKVCAQLKLPVGDVCILISDHEEAGTRMLLHAGHAVESVQWDIIIDTPGTDVLMIVLYISKRLSASHHIKTGAKDKGLASLTKVKIHIN